MIRRLFTAASVVSLLPVLASVALWVRTYWTTDLWRRAWAGESLRVVSTRGHVVIHRQWVPEISVEPWTHRAIPTRRIDERCVRCPPVWSLAGMSLERNDSASLPGWHNRVWVVPCYLPSMLCLVLPVMRAGSGVFERLRRRRPGVCRVCGYDLRASTRRCPECGIPISVGVTA